MNFIMIYQFYLRGWKLVGKPVTDLHDNSEYVIRIRNNKKKNIKSLLVLKQSSHSD